MKLAQAVSKIAELPKILEQYGIESEDVMTIEYNTRHDNAVDVYLYSSESIEKLGDFHAENIVNNAGDPWTKYKAVKAGISFICWKRQ